MASWKRFRDFAGKVPPPEMGSGLYGGVPLPRAPDPNRRAKLVVALVVGCGLVASLVIAAALR